MTLQGPLTLKMLSLPLYTAPQASHSRRAAERAVGRTVTGMLGALSGWLRHFLAGDRNHPPYTAKETDAQRG